MVVLSDVDIKKYIEEGKLIIKDLDHEKQIKQCSIDLRLGDTIRIFRHNNLAFIDTKKPLDSDYTELIKVQSGKPIIIHPNELIIAATIEDIEIPLDLVGSIDGRSSLGRIGIVVHSTACSIDPGWKGKIALEINNISKFPVLLWPGSGVCRITFTKLSTPTSKKGYAEADESKYKKQEGPEISKMSLDKYLK